MKMFIIKLVSGEYVTKCRMTTSYLNYERTLDRVAADRLNDFDSKLVLKKLATLGQKNASREEVAEES
jgi:hypothetical protein